MRTILQPEVVNCQQLIVASERYSLKSMPNSPEKALFSKRLNELCNDKKMPVHGRQTQLARKFKVTQEAARKWLDGESIPSYERMLKICEFFGAKFEWLISGNGPKDDNAEGFYINDPRVIHAAKVMMDLPDYGKNEGVQRIDALAQFIAQHGSKNGEAM